MGGHRLITQLGKNKYGGVAILIHERYADSIATIREFGERVLAVRIRDNSIKLTVISVYVPHAGYSVDDLHELYKKLRKATAWASSYSSRIIIGGDFNTQLDVGYRGKLLQDFANEYKLTIGNEQIGHQWDSTWTFYSSLGRKRQIDFILLGNGMNSLSVAATNNLCLGSDHRAVQLEISFTELTDDRHHHYRKLPP